MLCFNAVLNNCHPNGVSLEQPPMCRGLSLWIITDLLSGPLMWEMYLISICFRVYAVPVHLDWFISFGGWLKIRSHSFQVAGNWGPRSQSHMLSDIMEFLFSLCWRTAWFFPLNSVFLSSPHCLQPLMPRAHIPPRPHLKGPSCYSTV